MVLIVDQSVLGNSAEQNGANSWSVRPWKQRWAKWCQQLINPSLETALSKMMPTVDQSVLENSAEQNDANSWSVRPWKQRWAKWCQQLISPSLETALSKMMPTVDQSVLRSKALVRICCSIILKRLFRAKSKKVEKWSENRSTNHYFNKYGVYSACQIHFKFESHFRFSYWCRIQGGSMSGARRPSPVLRTMVSLNLYPYKYNASVNLTLCPLGIVNCDNCHHFLQIPELCEVVRPKSL